MKKQDIEIRQQNRAHPYTSPIGFKISILKYKVFSQKPMSFARSVMHLKARKIQSRCTLNYCQHNCYFNCNSCQSKRIYCNFNIFYRKVVHIKLIRHINLSSVLHLIVLLEIILLCAVLIVSRESPHVPMLTLYSSNV